MKVCALVPLYDNRRTVDPVVCAVREHIPDVIVVDDGSSDGGAETIRPFEGLVVLRHERNRGKGAALKTGFEQARSMGFTHVLQIDADHQHDPDDIPRFLEAARTDPTALIAGERIFDDTVPGSSVFGRRFGVFWYRLETGGHPLTDNQCGYRVYPLSLFERVRVRGDHMDFDSEVLVRAVWAGLPVLGLPTRVRYFPEGERVSGFRPFLDNLRFSILHCWMTNAYVLIRIGRFLRSLWPWKKR